MLEHSEITLRIVRDALLTYRAATRVNGRKHSWHHIAEAMHTEGVIAEEQELDDEKDSDEDYDYRRDRYPFGKLAEALRRFAANSQILGPERLEALCQYLIARKFLSKLDLQPIPPQSLLLNGLRSFFGGDFGPPDNRLTLPGTYYGTRKIGTRTEVSVLMVEPDSDGVYPVAETVYSLHQEPRSLKRDALLRQMHKSAGSEFRYEGYLVRAHGQHVMFVRDDCQRESSVDVLLRLFGGGEKTEMTVARSRDFGPSRFGYAREIMRFVEPSDDPALAGVSDRVWRYKRGDHG